MKNRNIPYYVAALMLAAGVSTSFVSCVDTEEPDSIVTLRNAKAEEVKAQAAKINAEVTDLLGRLELDKSTRALADEATKLANARKEAKNAYDKAIEDIQLAQKNREEDAAKATADFELQEAKAKAEANLKTALATLEAAKTALTQAQNQAVKDVEAEQLAIDKKKMAVAIETAQFKEWGLQNADGTYQLKGAKDDYVKALDDLSDALKALKKSIAKLEEDNIETITDKIEECEKTIADAQEGKAEFDALCKANDIQKWVTKYAELDKKISENDQNPVLSQAKYDKAGLEADLEKLTNQIQALKDKREGYDDPESGEHVDGLLDELEEKLEKTEEAVGALEEYLHDEVSINLEHTINNELAGQLSEMDALEDYIVDATDDNGKAIKKFVIEDLEIDGDEGALRNFQIDEDKLKEILKAVEKGESNSETLNQGFERLTKVSGALYQNIRAVEEGIKTLSTNKAEDDLVERVVPTRGKGTLTKWEECATDYLSHTDNQDSYNAFVEANNKLFGTFTGIYEDEEKTKPIYSDPVYYAKSNHQIPNQPLSVLPAVWDEENKKIDATNLVQYFGVPEANAVSYAKTWFGEYSEYLTIKEKNAKEAEYEEAKEQAEAIIAEIKDAFKNIPVKIAELKKAVDDAFAEEKKANADLVKQIEDIDAQILEKGDVKTLAWSTDYMDMDEEELPDEIFAAEDGTLIKKQKELNDQIKAKQEEIDKFDVSKERALRDAILTFGLKLNLFTLDDEGNVQVDEDKVEVAYDETHREDFEKAYQATIDYYNNAIESTQEDLKYYQDILKAFQDKISGANTAADDKDVNKAIDFDFSSKALKEFFESDDIAKDYADLIKDVEAKQTTVKEKEEALEKAEADYNFYKKAYGVDKAE